MDGVGDGATVCFGVYGCAMRNAERRMGVVRGASRSDASDLGDGSNPLTTVWVGGTTPIEGAGTEVTGVRFNGRSWGASVLGMAAVCILSPGVDCSRACCDAVWMG